MRDNGDKKDTNDEKEVIILSSDDESVECLSKGLRNIQITIKNDICNKADTKVVKYNLTPDMPNPMQQRLSQSLSKKKESSEEKDRKPKSHEKRPSIELYCHPHSPFRKNNQERRKSSDIQQSVDISKNKSTVNYREEDCVCKSKASLYFCHTCTNFFPRAKERCVVHPMKFYEKSFCPECLSMDLEELREAKY